MAGSGADVFGVWGCTTWVLSLRDGWSWSGPGVWSVLGWPYQVGKVPGPVHVYTMEVDAERKSGACWFLCESCIGSVPIYWRL